MTCCGKSNGGACVCAEEARCSCGARPARQCTCSKSTEENTVSGETCSCGKRRAHECTCSRSATENGLRDGEIDFTNFK
ncbi:uncharacterized protein V1518DRAFT_417432 [Limtongia smithiae]|uniref:uncharacterized protein n=1 Tax=Limtongia smithiae TaxID=1125753 RepID=UPI0034CEEE07